MSAGAPIFQINIFQNSIFQVGGLVGVYGSKGRKPRRRRPYPGVLDPIEEEEQAPEAEYPVPEGIPIPPAPIILPPPAAPYTAMTAMAQAMERAIARVETNLTEDEEEALIMLLVH